MVARTNNFLFGDATHQYAPHPHLTRPSSYWLEANGRKALVKRIAGRWVAKVYRIDRMAFRLITSCRPTSERKARRWAERVLGLYAVNSAA